jgi:hypothetical protein
MFITAIIIGVIALIGSIIMFLEGIIVMLSKNKISQGFYYLAGAGLLLFVTAIMGLLVLHALSMT